MNDSNFEREIEKLNSQERKKQPYYLESAERERVELLQAFTDHYNALSTFETNFSIDDLLNSVERQHDDFEEDTEEDSLTDKLSALIQDDLERTPELLTGEMQVSGEGLYMFTAAYDEDEQEDYVVDIIDEGATIMGTIRFYSVAPVIPYTTFLHTQRNDEQSFLDPDDVPPSAPGVWLMLSDATIRDGEGTEVRTVDEALVPLEYLSLKFDKVIRQADALAEYKPAEVQAPIHTSFKSDFLGEVCNDIENDLNYNEYTGQEHHELRAKYQEELGIYMSMVDREEEFIVNIYDAVLPSGEKVSLYDQAVRYSDPIIMNVEGTWRAVHAFEFTTDEGAPGVAHVLPEYLISIERKA